MGHTRRTSHLYIDFYPVFGRVQLYFLTHPTHFGEVKVWCCFLLCFILELENRTHAKSQSSEDVRLCFNEIQPLMHKGHDNVEQGLALLSVNKNGLVVYLSVALFQFPVHFYFSHGGQIILILCFLGNKLYVSLYAIQIYSA